MRKSKLNPLLLFLLFVFSGIFILSIPQAEPKQTGIDIQADGYWTFTYELDWTKTYLDDVAGAEISRNEEYIAVSAKWSPSGELLVYDKAGNIVFQNISGEVGRVDISQNGDFILLASNDGGFIYFFNTSVSDNAMWEHSAYTHYYSCKLSADGKHGIFSYSGGMRTVDCTDGSLLNLVSGAITTNGVDISSDGSEYVVGLDDGSIYYSGVYPSYSPLINWVWNLKMNDHGNLTFVEANSKYLYLINSTDLLWNYTCPDAIVNLDITNQGKIMAAASSNQLFLFGTESNKTKWIYNYTGSGEIRDVRIAGDGSYIYCVAGSILHVFENASAVPVLEQGITYSSQKSLILSNSGNYILVKADNYLRKWDRVWEFHENKTDGNRGDENISPDDYSLILTIILIGSAAGIAGIIAFAVSKKQSKKKREFKKYLDINPWSD
ncbi:MAG: hypothetical protein ACTSR8_12005 [Promethearchaeota archaeon]